MYSTPDFRKGLKIELDGKPQEIIDFLHVKPGKGGAFVRTKLKNLINGNVTEKTFRSGEKVGKPDLQEKKMQFLYREEDRYCFMDNQSYEQIFLTEKQVGEAKNFLIDNLEVEILMFEDRPLEISLPNFVDLTVVQADPWAKGDTVSGNTKPVVLQTGYQLQVPPFIEQGEKIRVDTRTGAYLTRVKG